MRVNTPTTKSFYEAFASTYRPIPISEMRATGKRAYRSYWIISGKAFEVEDHSIAADRAGVEFEDLIDAGAIRIFAYAGNRCGDIGGTAKGPSDTLDKAIFHLGSQLQEVYRCSTIAIEWGDTSYVRTDWNGFAAAGFKLAKRMKNTPVIKRIACEGDPRQMRLSQQNIPFSDFIGKVEPWRGNRVTALLENEDARLIIEQKLYEKTGIVPEWDGGLACGSFGCAFETSDPTIVLKLTEDGNEAAGAVALIGTGRWWPGVLGVHKVFRYPDYPVWALLTERVGSLDDEITFIQNQLGVPESFEPNFEQLLKMSEQMLGMLMRFQRKAVDMILHRKAPDDEQIQDWVERFVDHATGWSQLDAMRNTYEILWYEHHVVYPDVHFGNLGFRIYDGPNGMSPRCTMWDIDAEYLEGLGLIPGQAHFMGPEILCLDLGVSAGSGVAAAKKKRIAKLNPLWQPYINLIPEL